MLRVEGGIDTKVVVELGGETRDMWEEKVFLGPILGGVVDEGGGVVHRRRGVRGEVRHLDG